MLKLVIAVLTTLLVVGLVLLVWGMTRTAKRMTDRSAQAPRTYALPPGARLLETDLDGERVLLRLQIDGRQVLQVIDLSSGETIRQLDLEAAR